MEIVGIVCEYNPFHNGHIYHIKKIKEMYPNSLIILVLNGYIMQRGDFSILSKEDKVKTALDNNIDLVVELPFVFGSQASDVFAQAATIIMNHLGCTKIVFGSESADEEKLFKAAKMQFDDKFNVKVKKYLTDGVNYPTALNKALGININTPNDLLGISYIKSIIKNDLKLEFNVIQRTNDYHDTLSNEGIISASNIREKIINNIDVSKYTNVDTFNTINKDILFNLIKYKINTDKDLSIYLDVDEGIEYKLIKEINNVNSLDDLIKKIKSKRYTYNKINRMLIHILVGLTKEDAKKAYIEYIKVLGFNKRGQNYLKKIKKDILISSKIPDTYTSQYYENKVSILYDMICNTNTYTFESKHKPIKFD